MKQTLYDILEVPRDASFEDIEVAYAKRFEKLKGETSWDSNRLVMLNEAREVLSDAARRAAYDASLEAATQQPEARIHSVEIEDEPRSSGKWVVAGVIVVAAIIWFAMRDAPPPSELSEAQPPEAQAQFDTASQDETLIVLEGGDVADLADDEILSEIDAVYGTEDGDELLNESPAAAGEGAPVTAAADPSAAITAPEQTAVAPIVGFWDCFEPVTGRTSEYGFAADGSLTIRLPDGIAQSFAYEVAGLDVNVINSNPPRTLGIEELAARRLVLSSGAGQRLVCTR